MSKVLTYFMWFFCSLRRKGGEWKEQLLTRRKYYCILNFYFPENRMFSCIDDVFAKF
jgi:hypothetical protein